MVSQYALTEIAVQTLTVVLAAVIIAKDLSMILILMRYPAVVKEELNRINRQLLYNLFHSLYIISSRILSSKFSLLYLLLYFPSKLIK